MTREEIINIFKDAVNGAKDERYISFLPVKLIEAMDCAIYELEQVSCKDYISREQAKQAVRDKFPSLETRCEINTILNELPSVRPQKASWIPVSERLPKAGEYIGDVERHYLVQSEYGDMLVARYTHSEYWEQVYQIKPIADEVVAWMPLPDKYKESEG